MAIFQLQRHLGSSSQKDISHIYGNFDISKENIPICFGKKGKKLRMGKRQNKFVLGKIHQ